MTLMDFIRSHHPELDGSFRDEEAEFFCSQDGKHLVSFWYNLDKKYMFVHPLSEISHFTWMPKKHWENAKSDAAKGILRQLGPKDPNGKVTKTYMIESAPKEFFDACPQKFAAILEDVRGIIEIETQMEFVVLKLCRLTGLLVLGKKAGQ